MDRHWPYMRHWRHLVTIALYTELAKLSVVLQALLLRQIRPSACLSVCVSIRPSVRLSVTLRYCIKTRERKEMRSLPSCSPVSLVF